MKPKVRPLDGDHGLAIFDPIENTRFVLYTDRDVDPVPTDQDRITFPVGTAVSVDAGTLTIPDDLTVHVRTRDGEHVDTFEAGLGDRYSSDGGRLLDLVNPAMKLYVLAPGPFEITLTDDWTVELEFRDSTELTVGVRSYHERPTTTIETPREPEAVMRALSAAGSAMKATSCERSYPTLRGHPPTFEPAEELSIPSSLDLPDTNVQIRVPSTWEYVYPVAPLAYYLGASVRPGGSPRIDVGNWSFPLASADEDSKTFTERVHRTLQQVFFLDCLTRTEGLFQIELDERRRLADALELDFEKLYDQPIDRQVRAYLDVPYATIEDYLPSWHLCVDIQPSPDYVETLPYLLDDFALIRCPEPREPAELDEEIDQAITAFVRDSDGRSSAASNSNGESAQVDVPPLEEEVFSPAPAPTIEQAYIGDGLPLRRNKLTVESLERRLEYDASADESISVQIVCNDQKMSEEAIVEQFYGVHDFLQYDVDVVQDLTRDQLAAAFREDVDMLHYIGHNDDEGFECVDGKLDARDLDDVGVETFLLNACKSYEQGQALINNGARVGVASLSLVSNAAANRLGQTMARALNAGFTFRSALSLTEFTTSATQYIVLGDGGTQLARASSGVPCLVELVDADLDSEAVTIDLLTYPDSPDGQGATWSPSFTSFGESAPDYLVFGHLDRFTLDIDEFVELQSVQPNPVVVEGQLYWSDELDRRTFSDMLSRIEHSPTPRPRELS
ncbi:hypothetical protein BRC81_03465 [Halobacteriales archaeon QS_1_68_20]|nr:MAG: hypothetical protein BRC81_03465 [Halobacteriales archaeon QS_1_68_20]